MTPPEPAKGPFWLAVRRSSHPDACVARAASGGWVRGGFRVQVAASGAFPSPVSSPPQAGQTEFLRVTSRGEGSLNAAVPGWNLSCQCEPMVGWAGGWMDG